MANLSIIITLIHLLDYSQGTRQLPPGQLPPGQLPLRAIA